MKNLITFMAHNHVAATLLMLFFVVGGLFTVGTINQEIFPDARPESVNVRVAFPGATPAEVEDAVVLPIELAVSEITYIKRIQSVARENGCSVTIELVDENDIDAALQEVKNAVDRIRTFPQEVERPLVSKRHRTDEVANVVVYGTADERALLELAESVRDDLIAFPEITIAQISGHRPYEVSIEIPEENLRRYNLTLNRVAAIVREASLDLGGGVIREEGGDVLVRTTEKRTTRADFAEVPVFRGESGETVLLGEIGRVTDGFAPTDLKFRFDSWPAVVVQVNRVGDQKPGEIADVVKRYVEARNRQLPPSAQLSMPLDFAEGLRGRIDLLTRNAMMGGILVFFILALFLEIRLAFWVSAGMVISFLGGFLLMPAFDISINSISLFAFLIVIGIVVDDAIVIGENIFVEMQKGKKPLQAAVDGARGMSRPVTFAVLTTVAAFSALLFLSGFIGRLVGQIPPIVIIVLLVSLVESMFILPAHLSGNLVRSQARIWTIIEDKRRHFDRFLTWVIENPYARLQHHAQSRRYLTVAVALAIVMLCGGLAGGGFLKFSFVPPIEDDQIAAVLTMNPGTSVGETGRRAEEILEVGLELMDEHDSRRTDGSSNLRHQILLVGSTIDDGAVDADSEGSNLAQLMFFLSPPDERDISAIEFANEWRARVGEVAGADKIEFSAEATGRDPDIEVQLTHPDYSALIAASDRLKQALKAYAGVGQVIDSHTDGKRELKLRLKPEAGALGITETDLAIQVRSAVYGAEAMRIQRDRHEVKVMRRYPERVRRTLSSIAGMMLRTPDGREIPFREAAFVEEGTGFSEIIRMDQRRVITVSAKVDDKIANAKEILAELTGGELQTLLAQYPGLSYDLEGESREERDSIREIAIALLWGNLAIFSLLAIAFRSYVQPLIIMSAIPFGIVGVVLGHIPFGLSISIMSMLGIVAMAGVVVNASLVLIDSTNQIRASGHSAFDAAMLAGQRRFRPVVITTLTTFFGLMPIVLEKSIHAQFLVPLAVSLSFGVLASTAVTLVLVPSFYLIVEDLRSIFGSEAAQTTEPDESALVA